MRTTYARHEQNIYNWITAIFRQKELIMFFLENQAQRRLVSDTEIYISCINDD